MSALRIARRTASDIKSGSSEVIRTGVKKGTSPLSIAALGGAGAYSYGQYTDQQETDSESERYETYQDRLTHIENQYNKGEISKTEKERLEEQARQDYQQSFGEEQRGLTLPDLIGQMGTVQLIAVSAVSSLAIYFIARPLARSLAENGLNAEGVLG